jgi:hypothetical protein
MQLHFSGNTRPAHVLNRPGCTRATRCMFSNYVIRATRHLVQAVRVAACTPVVCVLLAFFSTNWHLVSMLAPCCTYTQLLGTCANP